MATTVDDVLLHTLGLADIWRPIPLECYRNYFVAGEGHHSWVALCAAEEAGLMKRRRRPGFLNESDVVFCATAAGEAHARGVAVSRRPRLTRDQQRYQRWLDITDVWDMSFGDWLRAGCP